MKRRIGSFAVSVAALLLAACGGGTPHPTGWQPEPGPSPAVWTSGSGPATQTYRLSRHAFSGTLQDLASQEAIDVVLRRHGARLQRSQTFKPCPGLAALATFSLPGGRLLDRAFAVQNGQATIVSYERPAAASTAQAVEDAMRQTLCIPPA